MIKDQYKKNLENLSCMKQKQASLWAYGEFR